MKDVKVSVFLPSPIKESCQILGLNTYTVLPSFFLLFCLILVGEIDISCFKGSQDSNVAIEGNASLDFLIIKKDDQTSIHRQHALCEKDCLSTTKLLSS